MKGKTTSKDWLPLAKTDGTPGHLPTGEAFRPEWIDFERGIRVGNLEPHERITQILKYYLEQTYGTRFITDRWGRGVYWQWICWLPRANREAKPVSHNVNFGCAKLFIQADREEQVFKSGLQVERGYVEGGEAREGWRLGEDWDWHRLVKQCWTGTVLDREMPRLLKREGFTAEIGGWEANRVFTAGNFTSARKVRDVLRRCSKRHWAGFQLYYPMPAREVQACTGYELVRAICGVFTEVIPAMNACMQIELTPAESAYRGPSGP